METRGKFSRNKARIHVIKTHYSNLKAFLKNLEYQMGKLLKELKGKSIREFPSNIKPNIKRVLAI